MTKRVTVFPLSNVPFTQANLKETIPAHCFERSLVRSLMCVVRQVVYCISLTWLAVSLLGVVWISPWLRVVIYLGYLALQGCVLFGFWVLGHEAGHHAFSDWPLIDDLVGFVLHTALLTPYYSMKYTHRQHHAFTGNVERDSAYVPEGDLVILSSFSWFFFILCFSRTGVCKGKRGSAQDARRVALDQYFFLGSTDRDWLSGVFVHKL